MAVGADDAVSCSHHSLLRKEGMLDAHLSHVIEMAYAVGAGKFPALLRLLCCLDVLVGDKVVQNDGHPVLVKYLVKACLFEFIDSHRRRDVVSQDDVQLCFDELSRLYLRKSRVGCQDLLCHCHSHDYFPPSRLRLMAEKRALMEEAMISSWIPAPHTRFPFSGRMLT